jgi:hypothetical protein
VLTPLVFVFCRQPRELEVAQYVSSFSAFTLVEKPGRCGSIVRI